MPSVDQYWLDMNAEEVTARVRDLFGDVSHRVLDQTAVLWSSWECDHTAVLVELGDGRREVVILGATSVGGPVDLRERLAAYRQAVTETEALLELLSHGSGNAASRRYESHFNRNSSR